MKKILFIALLLTTSIYIYGQKIDDIISSFSNQQCSLLNNLNENEWKYTRYVLSKIEPSFYELKRENQNNDIVSNAWFNKIFTRGKGENYSLDFNKVRIEASKVDVSDLPDIREFVFIGMKISLLKKTNSITYLELGNCPANTQNNFREQIQQIKDSYEVLTDLKDDDTRMFMMKNKEPDSFHELIIIEYGKEPYLVRLKGKFSISDLSAPEKY